MSNELETQINDELLKDKIFNFLKKNKIIFSLIIFILIILPISLQVFFLYQNKKQEHFISKYIEADILLNNKDIRGIQILNLLKDKGNDTARLLAVNKLAEYYLNSNNKEKALKILSDAENFDNNMFKELIEIKFMIMNFDNIKENEILSFSRKGKTNEKFKLIKTKLLYDYYVKSKQFEKAKQVQRNFK